MARGKVLLGCSGTLPHPRPCPSGAGGRRPCRRRWRRAAAARARGCGDTTPTTLTGPAQAPTASLLAPQASWEHPKHTHLTQMVCLKGVKYPFLHARSQLNQCGLALSPLLLPDNKISRISQEFHAFHACNKAVFYGSCTKKSFHPQNSSSSSIPLLRNF